MDLKPTSYYVEGAFVIGNHKWQHRYWISFKLTKYFWSKQFKFVYCTPRPPSNDSLLFIDSLASTVDMLSNNVSYCAFCFVVQTSLSSVSFSKPRLFGLLMNLICENVFFIFYHPWFESCWAIDNLYLSFTQSIKTCLVFVFLSKSIHLCFCWCKGPQHAQGRTVVL